MFRVIDFGHPDVTVSEGDQKVGPPPEGVMRWIDLESQDASQLELLKCAFHFHPLAIEDCEHRNQRPKLDDYDDHVFIVTHGFRLPEDESGDLHVEELHVFLSERYLVTVHTECIPALNRVWKRMSENNVRAKRGIDFLYYMLLDAIVDSLFDPVEAMQDELDELQDDALRDTAPQDLNRVFRIKRLLLTMRKTLSAQQDVVGQLAIAEEDSPIKPRTAVFFRDVHDHLLRLLDSVDLARDLVGNTLDAHLWAASHKANQAMKRLSVLGAIFLPLTFITGFFGQNFEHLPFDQRWMFFTMIAACLTLPAIMLFVFWRLGMISGLKSESLPTSTSRENS